MTTEKQPIAIAATRMALRIAAGTAMGVGFGMLAMLAACPIRGCTLNMNPEASIGFISLIIMSIALFKTKFSWED